MLPRFYCCSGTAFQARQGRCCRAGCRNGLPPSSGQDLRQAFQECSAGLGSLLLLQGLHAASRCCADSLQSQSATDVPISDCLLRCDFQSSVQKVIVNKVITLGTLTIYPMGVAWKFDVGLGTVCEQSVKDSVNKCLADPTCQACSSAGISGPGESSPNGSLDPS